MYEAIDTNTGEVLGVFNTPEEAMTAFSPSGGFEWSSGFGGRGQYWSLKQVDNAGNFLDWGNVQIRSEKPRRPDPRLQPPDRPDVFTQGWRNIND